MRRLKGLIVLALALPTTAQICHRINVLAEARADVRISNMDNLGLGSWDGSGDVNDEDNVCVFNDSGPGYLITASGSGGGGAYELSNGSEAIQYEVRFKGSSGSFTSIGANSSHSFSAADETDSSCGGGTNASIRVTVQESELLKAHKGSYSGSLNVQVDPN